MAGRYLEDFKVGDRFAGGSFEVTEEAIVAYARQFDPQAFHLDRTAAKESLFGELVASGWHTASLTMKLTVERGINPVNGVIGMGVEQLNWPRPVRPGDRLSIRDEVLEVRPSKSKPDRGVLRVRMETLNQNDEVVQSFVANLIVLRRPAA